MEESVVRKKRELVLFLLTVIALAFLVSTFANLIFSNFYKGNEILFTTICTAIFCILSIFALWFLLNERFKSKIDVLFIYAFSRKTKSFLDIPNCLPSVNARVLFNDLSIDLKSHYSKLDTWDDFHFSDFEDYIHQLTQAIILMRILRQRPNIKSGNWQEVDFAKAPLSIRNNKCIKNYLRDQNLFLPSNARIETFGHNENFITIKSKFGKIVFKWGVSYCQMAHFSDPYLSLSGLKSGYDYHDFMINVEFSADHNFAKFISKDLKEYLEFVECIKRDLNNYDWKKTERLLTIELLKVLINGKTNK